MSILSLVLVAFFSQAGSAEAWLKVHPKALDEYVERCRKEHAEHVRTETFTNEQGVAGAEGELARLKKVPIRIQKNNTTKEGVIVVFKNKEAKASMIKTVEARLQKHQAALDAVKALDGQVILSPLTSLELNDMGAINIVEVVQVAADKEARVKLQGGKDDIWLDYPTAAFVDGEKYKFKESKLAIVVGTKRYTTVGGGPRTIPRVALIDMPDFKRKPDEGVKAEVVK